MDVQQFPERLAMYTNHSAERGWSLGQRLLHMRWADAARRPYPHPRLGVQEHRVG